VTVNNTVSKENIVQELKKGCIPIYTTMFALNTMNTVCITTICAVQATVIVYKFFYYFISTTTKEEDLATMSDKKVVVHSS